MKQTNTEQDATFLNKRKEKENSGEVVVSLTKKPKTGYKINKYCYRFLKLIVGITNTL